MVAVNGRIKVSTDYTYNLSGDGYLDTGCNVTANHYNATMHVVKGFGAIPSEEIGGNFRQLAIVIILG